ncbi:hypothetical protein ceV_049 [Chrysochromulina ericina virus CeV-01B]|uniref:Uncharacterized protein n=1 Tax=Chrysochromulina ericina virus CeV-01B TaxID=3070830 RepID=A0A0N9Q967_9VIRU|nr:hypothetical protein ceV_049 [Chrysochromulina ericina virus]ALH22955.1 hypothetical protein ceV_049 [Chrysochromulina ericina virus CeV-01B]|tara:strand:- start:14643 stop:14972 length:330 start_codon:yes stop_codon:yes gene_type:complete
MSNQVFKKIIPNNMLSDLLKEICDKKDDYYILNRIAFKKAEYYNLFDKLINELKDYYHNSKQFYLTRKLTYNFFLTIIRQLCKSLNVSFNTKIYYCKSVYDITYHIYIN